MGQRRGRPGVDGPVSAGHREDRAVARGPVQYLRQVLVGVDVNDARPGQPVGDLGFGVRGEDGEGPVGRVRVEDDRHALSFRVHVDGLRRRGLRAGFLLVPGREDHAGEQGGGCAHGHAREDVARVVDPAVDPREAHGPGQSQDGDGQRRGRVGGDPEREPRRGGGVPGGEGGAGIGAVGDARRGDRGGVRAAPADQVLDHGRTGVGRRSGQDRPRGGASQSRASSGGQGRRDHDPGGHVVGGLDELRGVAVQHGGAQTGHPDVGASVEALEPSSESHGYSLLVIGAAVHVRRRDPGRRMFGRTETPFR